MTRGIFYFRFIHSGSATLSPSVLSLAELAVQAAEDPKFVCVLSSKEHTLYLSFLGPNNPPLSSPKFGSCLQGVSVWHYINIDAMISSNS